VCSQKTAWDRFLDQWTTKIKNHEKELNETAGPVTVDVEDIRDCLVKDGLLAKDEEYIYQRAEIDKSINVFDDAVIAELEAEEGTDESAESSEDDNNNNNSNWKKRRLE
jgi:hypothetical protein